MKAKAVGWDNLSFFVLLNRYLDIADMIEDNGDSADATLLDNTDFEQTGIPFDKLCIPARPCVNGALKEQAKQWVLAVSLDQRIEQQLPLDERGVYEACLINCWKKSSDPPATPCVLTGYPVLRQPVKFPAQRKETNREAFPGGGQTKTIANFTKRLILLKNGAMVCRQLLQHS
ncbi:Intraflagellar transport protein 172 [Daphnia magna]|uniref:Intraflagellar transport protein 172 n=1 Tax=Daphnia magna TaxID=35525 RepID=A0A164EBH2_9CRUS|nr:Intraflagellar transport protein 172 [Daphnia magna]